TAATCINQFGKDARALRRLLRTDVPLVLGYIRPASRMRHPGKPVREAERHIRIARKFRPLGVDPPIQLLPVRCQSTQIEKEIALNPSIPPPATMLDTLRDQSVGLDIKTPFGRRLSAQASLAPRRVWQSHSRDPRRCGGSW